MQKPMSSNLDRAVAAPWVTWEPRQHGLGHKGSDAVESCVTRQPSWPKKTRVSPVSAPQTKTHDQRQSGD